MTKEQEQQMEQMFREKLKEQHSNGMKAGATGILGAVLDMCSEGKTVDDIKKFCETMLDVK